MSDNTRKPSYPERPVFKGGENLPSQIQAEAMVDLVPALIVVIGRDYQIKLINHAGAQMLGYAKEALIDRDWFEMVVPAEEREVRRQRFNGFFDGSEAVSSLNDLAFLSSRNEHVTIALHNSLLLDESGHAIAVLASGEDISKRREAEKRLLESEAKEKAANERLSATVATLERQNHDNAVMGEMSELLQACRNPEETYAILAKTIERTFPDSSGSIHLFHNSRNYLESVVMWGKAAEHDQTVFGPEACWGLRRGKIHLVTPGGIAPACSHLNQAPAGGLMAMPLLAQGEVIGVLHLYSDCTSESECHLDQKKHFLSTLAEQYSVILANLRLSQRLQNQSLRDPLTGLYNRRYMEESLEREEKRAKRQNSPLALLMFDIDHFKNFNDDYGHKSGDLLLQHLGTFLKSEVRGEDIACRYGGEEFLLILPSANIANAAKRAEEIRLGVKSHLAPESLGPQTRGVTISCGVAVMPDHADSAEEAIKLADQALYQSKNTGRDRVTVATRPEAPAFAD